MAIDGHADGKNPWRYTYDMVLSETLDTSRGGETIALPALLDLEADIAPTGLLTNLPQFDPRRNVHSDATFLQWMVSS